MKISFYSCLNCGSFQVQNHQLCWPCTNLLQPLQTKKIYYAQDLLILPLYVWPPGLSDTLSRLILNLKIAPVTSWQYYAKQFCSSRYQNLKQRPITFVTHKSHSGGKHAQNWAESFRQILGGHHYDALEFNELTQSQKSLSKISRSTRVFKKCVDISWPQESEIVFIDDVVTTGYTALAAYKALNQPRNFQVWCLAWRPPSTVAAGHRAW